MTDEFVCDTPEVREFIGNVKECIARGSSVEERLALIRPYFDQMLSKPDWLPAEYRRTLESGGMGKGIANWLLYRDTQGTLSLAALVMPPGIATPVHDHLAWGLVGLYSGEQDEEVFETAAPVGSGDQYADLKLVNTNHLVVGSFYALIPPTGDIHRVTTTSDISSISLHLLANDIGCVLRHTFTPETGEVIPFLSRYSNYDCEAEESRMTG